MQAERNIRIKNLALWTGSWLATLAIATFGSKYLWEEHHFLISFTIMVNLANGVMMILANRNLFNHFDELERKIHLEAMALTLGLSIIVGVAYSLLKSNLAIDLKSEVSVFLIFTAVTYLIAVFFNTKRYQ